MKWLPNHSMKQPQRFPRHNHSLLSVPREIAHSSSPSILSYRLFHLSTTSFASPSSIHQSFKPIPTRPVSTTVLASQPTSALISDTLRSPNPESSYDAIKLFRKDSERRIWSETGHPQLFNSSASHSSTMHCLFLNNSVNDVYPQLFPPQPTIHHSFAGSSQ